MNNTDNMQFCKMSGLDQKQTLTNAMHHALVLKGRKMPDNLDDMASCLKGMLIKYMPFVNGKTIYESIEDYILHEDTTSLSVEVFFKAIRKHYTPPYQQRDMDIETYTRPDTEKDEFDLLDVLADHQAKGKEIYADWPREYAYLLFRNQLQWDAYEAHIEHAKSIINADRLKEMKRSILDWVGHDNHSMLSVAKQLAVKEWLKGCTARGLKPSDILEPMRNDSEYSQFRYDYKFKRA